MIAVPFNVTVLKCCRCRDCRRWNGKACRLGIIVNGARAWGGEVAKWAGYPADAWHYCAAYDGPQLSKDAYLWPTTPDVGPCGDKSTRVGPRGQGRERGHTGQHRAARAIGMAKTYENQPVRRSGIEHA